jgi:hypothetical protein
MISSTDTAAFVVFNFFRETRGGYTWRELPVKAHTTQTDADLTLLPVSRNRVAALKERLGL